MPIQLKRGNAADFNPADLLVGEPAFVIDEKKLMVGDGDGDAVLIPDMPEVNNAVIDRIIEYSAALTPTISGNSTTRDLTVAEGTNPNRMTILLTSATSASSAIRLRVGTGTYYNIVKPTGSGTDNVLSLSAYVPYDLILVNIGGTLRYVCLNYFDTLSRADRMTDLGVGKLLWEGSWSSGDITVPEINNYILFKIELSGVGTAILAIRHSSYLRGIGGYSSATPNIITFHFAANISGTTLSFVACNEIRHMDTSTHNAITNNTVVRITGLI